MSETIDRVKRFLGIKTAATIEREVLEEPTMRRAHQAIARGEMVLAELEALERRKPKGKRR